MYLPKHHLLNFYTLLLFCSLYFNSFSQQDAIPKHIITDFFKDKESYLKHPKVPEKMRENFAGDNAINKFNLVFYHNIYYNQPILVDYVRSILKRLDPAGGEADQLDVYITKQTQFNAFTIADGSVFINIAALADMTSEAELAFLLGHEYGHYKLRHAEQGYIQSRENGINPSQKQQQKSASFSQNLEFQADSLGYKMAYDAGYDYRAMDLLLQRLLFYQKKGILLRYAEYKSDKVVPTSHPVSEGRIEHIKLLNTVSNNGLLNPSGEDRFENIKKLAEFEYLKVLDESSDLLSAISFPLNKFLLTDDKKYLPVMIRAIRKAMLLMPEIIEKPFMTVHFQQDDQHFKEKENLFSNLFLEYPDSVDVKKMYKNPSIDFKKVSEYTFEKAFKYFADMATKEGFQEPLLDLALHYGVKSGTGGHAISQYLLKENNLYHDYAQQLKEQKIVSSLQNGQDLVLFGGVHNYVFKKKWMYADHENFFNGRHGIIASLREKYTLHELDYKIYDYLDYIQKNEIGKYLTTIEQLIYSGYASKMLEYDPRIYYCMKQANIRSLEYLRVDHVNVRKRIFYQPIMFPLALWTRYKSPQITSQHFSIVYYYRLGLSESNVDGVNNGYIKAGPMTKKRAQRVMYKLHKKTRKLTNS